MKTRSIKKALPRLARTTILLLIALILPAGSQCSRQLSRQI